MELVIIWLQFFILTSVISFTGYNLSRFADNIAEITGLGRNIIGLILLSTVSSLPELMTGISSIALTDNPNLAVGDILGSCVFNLATVFILDFIYRSDGSVYARSTQGHIMTASLGIIMLSFVGFSLAAGNILGFNIGHVGISSLLIPIFYFLSLKEIYSFEKQTLSASSPSDSKGSLKRNALYFSINALFIILAGSALPFVGEKLIVIMGWNAAFVGTVFIALATSLPEIAITISAVKLNAVELAFSNLLGSNIFNVIILAIDDMMYTKGSLFSVVSITHTVTCFSALMMTGLIIIALMKPPQRKIFNTVSVMSLLLLSIYFANMYISYHAEISHGQE